MGRRVVTVKKAYKSSEIGGKDSVKGNRQGFLSRSIKPFFKLFQKFEKRTQRGKKYFCHAACRPIGPARLLFIYLIYLSYLRILFS